MRRTFTCSTPGRTGQRECNRKADEWVDDGIESKNRRINELYDEWIESLKLTTSKSHWNVYEAFGRNWIKPAWGHIKIDRLSEQHLQYVIDNAFADGKAKKTLIDLRACMIAFIKYCRRKKLTSLVPEFLTIPKSAKPSERTVLQPNDIKMLFTCDTTLYKGKPKFEFYIHAFRFQVATGLRPGELIGLRWEDISNHCVNLRPSINKYRDTTRGKNDNAMRTFKLHKITAAILQSQIDLLREHNIKSGYVFPNEQGECTD